jgi:hypothetical protein
MTIHGRDWLTARAREGCPTTDVYTVDEGYPGERADLIQELRAALSGCDEPESDRLGRAMLAAVGLNSLPVLRAVVAVWREAYLGLLDQMTAPMTHSATLGAEEWERLRVLKQRITLRDVIGD